jgi:hypothetical protein
MSWKWYVLPSFIAGIALSSAPMFALAQTTTTQVPAHTKTSTQGTLSAQSTPPLRTPGTTGGSTTIKPGGTVIPGTRTPGGNRREPCWQVAGVSRSAMEQRRAISMQTRQEVEAVCANPSLSGAQKQQRIREIHQQERQQTEALISPAKREAMHACQQGRGAGGGGGGLIGGHGEGPCGTRPAVGRRLNPSVTHDESPDTEAPQD